MNVRGGLAIAACRLRQFVFGTIPRLVETARWNRGELGVLAIPLIRATLYPFGFVPVGFDESMVNPIVRVGILLILGIGALGAGLGVLARRPVLEATGLLIVIGFSLAYSVVLVAANWHDALVSVLIYLVIAAVCADRTEEITRNMAIVHRWLSDET